MKFAYSQAVRTIAVSIREQAAELAANLEYLRIFGRAAALPEVRHRIAGSVFFPDLSEVRTPLEPNNPDAAHARTLAYFAPDDERIFLAVCGDKSTSWAEHYQRAIPLGDELYRRWLDEQGLAIATEGER